MFFIFVCVSSSIVGAFVVKINGKTVKKIDNLILIKASNLYKD